MLNFLWSSVETSTQIILGLAIIIFSGFLLTRFTQFLKLPDVTGYILAGVLIGSDFLDLLPKSLISGMSFVTDIALAFIAFGIGEVLTKGQVRNNKIKIVIITLFESLTAGLLVFILMYYGFKLPITFSLLLGAISSATAPASILMIIRQYKAEGPLVDTLVQVVALDDAVSLIAFSVSIAILNALNHGHLSITNDLLQPIFINLSVILFGYFLGRIVAKNIKETMNPDHNLIFLTALLFLLTGFCNLLNISPLLSCMVMGITYTNKGGYKGLFTQIKQFTPTINLLFFVLSGLHFDLVSMKNAGLIGLAYFFIRIVGKYLGAWMGARITNSHETVKKYLGLALIPQAGVSIGLALLGRRLLPTQEGTLLSTIILSSGFLYEIFGPIAAKQALQLSGTFTLGTRKEDTLKTSIGNYGVSKTNF